MLNLRRISLFGKMMAAHVAVILSVVVFTGAAFLILTSRYLESDAQSEMESAARLASNVIRKNLSDAALYSRLTSNNYEIRNGLKSGNHEAVTAAARRELDRLEADFISIAGVDGVVFSYATRVPQDGAAAEISSSEPLFLSPAFQEAASTGTGASGVEAVFPGAIAAVAVAPIMDEIADCPSAARGSALKEDDCAARASPPVSPIGYVRIGYFLDDRFIKKVYVQTGTHVVIEYRGNAICSTFELADKTAPSEKLKANYFTRHVPIKNGDRRVARLLTVYPRARVASVQQYGMVVVAGIAVLAFALSVLMSAFASRRIVGPLNELTRGVQRVEAGELNYRVPRVGGDEIDALAGSFNRMAEALERRADEIRLNQDQLIESGKLAAIGELAAGVAHEIGNPLAAISGYMQLLRDAPPDKLDHYLVEVNNEVGFIDSTIRELLDFARPAAAEKEVVPVDEAIDEALRILSFHKIMKFVEVRHAPCPGNPAIHAGRREIVQAVLNISLNAAQAMHGNGLIDISVSFEDDLVTLRVRDTGPGIAAEDAARVFEPFFTTKRTGTGLGLSITYRIIINNNGEISVDSSSDEGTTFILKFPAISVLSIDDASPATES